MPGGFNSRPPLSEGSNPVADRKAEVDEAQTTFDLDSKIYTAEMDTSKGPIRLVFFPDKAPGHVKNFLALSKIGFYNGLNFHRIIKGFMIQGGCPEGTGTGDAGYKVKAEFNDIPHEPGILSMARATDPNSAGSQFFICLEKHPSLDHKYTVFGKVADEESMATVRALGDIPTDRNDHPKEDAIINSVTISESPK